MKTEYKKEGIYFLPLNQMTDSVEQVSNPLEFVKEHGDEIEWCIKYLIKNSGYAIAFPQIGLNYNGAVIRDGYDYMICFNIAVETVDNYFTTKHKKKKRKSLEQSYSVEQSEIPFMVPRHKKIFASWEEITTEKKKGKTKEVVKTVGKVYRYPKNMNRPTLGVIFQHLMHYFNQNLNEVLVDERNKQFRQKRLRKHVVEFVCDSLDNIRPEAV